MKNQGAVSLEEAEAEPKKAGQGAGTEAGGGVVAE